MPSGSGKLEGVEFGRAHFKAQTDRLARRCCTVRATLPANHLASGISPDKIAIASAKTGQGSTIDTLDFHFQPATSSRIHIECEPVSGKFEGRSGKSAALVRRIGREETIQAQPAARSDRAKRPAAAEKRLGYC